MKEEIVGGSRPLRSIENTENRWRSWLRTWRRHLFFQDRRERHTMDTCSKGGRSLRGCVLDGLNFLCEVQCRHVQSQERRPGGSGKVSKAWNHTLRNGRRNWLWAWREYQRSDSPSVCPAWLPFCCKRSSHVCSPPSVAHTKMVE